MDGIERMCEMLNSIKKSYRFKIFISIFCVLAVVLIGFSVYVFKTQKKQELENMERYNENIVASINNNFDMLNRNLQGIIANVYNSPSATRIIYQKNFDTEQFNIDNKNVSDELLLIPDIHSAVLYNNQKKQFCYYYSNASELEGITANISNRGNKTASLTPYINMITGRTGKSEIVLTYYIFDYLEGNTMNGALAVSIKLDWLRKVISDLNVDNINAIICDRDGRVLFDYKGTHQYKQLLNNEYVSAAQDSLSNGGLLINSGKNKYFLTAHELPHTNYIIICEQSIRHAYITYIGQIWINIMLLLLLLVAVCMCAQLLSRYIAAPVERLRTRIQNSGSTDYDDKDVFECISEILDHNADNNIQMLEMRSFVDDVRQQEKLKGLLYGEPALTSDDGVLNELYKFFGSERIVCSELLFKNRVDMNDVRAACQTALEKCGGYKLVVLEVNAVMLIMKTIGEKNTAVNEAMERLQGILAEQVKQKPSVFVSTMYSFEEISQAYNEIRIIRGYELMYGSGCLINSDIINQSNSEKNVVYPKEEENKILRAVINKDLSAVELLFDEFLKKVIVMDVNDFKKALMRLSFTILGLYEDTLSITNGTYGKIEAIIKYKADFNDMSDVYECFTELFKVCCSKKQENDEKEYHSPIVKSVLACIDRDFAKPDLNLDMIAEQLKLSTNYVGKKFKEELGIPVSKYLKVYRLEKSISYLNDPSVSIKSIIDKIGFVSESNYYKQFKEHYLMTPSDYRNANIKKD